MEKTLKILKSFTSPEEVKLPNGKKVAQGVRLGPGEEDLLQYFSKAAITKLTEGNFIGEPKTNSNDGVVFTKNFLEGLCSPRGVDRLSKLLTEKRFSVNELKIVNEKIKSVISSGIEVPILNLLQDQVSSQLYDKVILNNES